MNRTLTALLLLFIANTSPAGGDRLGEVLEGSWRSEANRARDVYRHPRETLEFFGIEPDMTVVELWPGGGWYAEILAPYLKDDGRYIAAHFWEGTELPQRAFFMDSLREFKARVEAEPEVFGSPEIVPFEPPLASGLPDDASVDMVLTFRNVHNWMRTHSFEAVLEDVYQALRPGGVLGVVEHRADSHAPIDPEARNGYVHQEEVIRMATEAGFELVATSRINENPKDTADHANGVWTLPPNLRVPEGEDPEFYRAIGESDRMTVKFIKPAD